MNLLDATVKRFDYLQYGPYSEIKLIKIDTGDEIIHHSHITWTVDITSDHKALQYLKSVLSHIGNIYTVYSYTFEHSNVARSFLNVKRKIEHSQLPQLLAEHFVLMLMNTSPQWEIDKDRWIRIITAASDRLKNLIVIAALSTHVNEPSPIVYKLDNGNEIQFNMNNKFSVYGIYDTNTIRSAIESIPDEDIVNHITDHVLKSIVYELTKCHN